MQLTPRDKKILQITAIALPVLLLVYFFVLRPDGGEDLALPSGPTGVSGTTGAPIESPSVTPSPTPRETLPPVSLAGSRDPFSIPPGLAVTSGSVSPPTTGAIGTTTSTPPVTTTTFPPITTTTPPPLTTTSTTATSPPPPPDGGSGNKILIGGHNVKLVSIAGTGKKLDVSVDGKVYTVETGATFDDNFKLVKIDGTCAKFLFGDQSFELCEK
ncbi:MAG: hypothetical protein WB297_14860 [Actinomycetota bacterium]